MLLAMEQVKRHAMKILAGLSVLVVVVLSGGALVTTANDFFEIREGATVQPTSASVGTATNVAATYSQQASKPACRRQN